MTKTLSLMILMLAGTVHLFTKSNLIALTGHSAWSELRILKHGVVFDTPSQVYWSV